jgi:putative transposase
MPNHFHLLLRQLISDGVFYTKIRHRYSKYFNQKNQRVGPLFQNRFKAISVENDEYLMHLSRYIHLNPLELIMPNWKKSNIKDLDQADSFLESYRYSSLPDYLGKKNFLSVIFTEFLRKFFPLSSDYKKNSLSDI